MDRKIFFHKWIIWLFVILSLAHVLGTFGLVTTAATPMATGTWMTTSKPQRYYGPSNNYGDSYNYDGYNNDNYNNDNYNNGNYNNNNYNNDNYNNDNYNNNNYNNNNNYDGVDPSKYGTDYADYGPTYSDKGTSLSQSLDLWIYAADDWEQKGSSGGRYGNNYNKKYRGKKYNKNKNYGNDDDYKGDYRGKRSYSRVRFPVKQIKNYRRFPIGRFPPLISIFPWLPIFYDKLTYQTFIFSPAGGIYIIPPLINFYGERFAVAQLIKWGYASLVSTGAPPPPNVDVAPLVQPTPAGGVAAGVVGGGSSGPAPTYDSKKYRFNDGVKTDFPTFKPRYSQTIEEGGDRNYGSSSGKSYGVDSDYGGTRNQQVYAQDGQRSGSGGGGGAYNY